MSKEYKCTRPSQGQLIRQATDEAPERQKTMTGEKKPHQWPKVKVIGAICIVTILLIAYGAWQYSIIGNNSPEPIGPAPGFGLMDPFRRTYFTLNQFSGKVIALHFMIVGCHGLIYPIDDNQIRQLRMLCNSFCENSQFTIITVLSSNCATSNLSQIRSDYGITWPMGNDYDDGAMDIFDAYASFSIQDGSILLIDRTLNVTQVHTDPITATEMTPEIEKLLET